MGSGGGRELVILSARVNAGIKNDRTGHYENGGGFVPQPYTLRGRKGVYKNRWDKLRVWWRGFAVQATPGSLRELREHDPDDDGLFHGPLQVALAEPEPFAHLHPKRLLDTGSGVQTEGHGHRTEVIRPSEAMQCWGGRGVTCPPPYARTSFAGVTRRPFLSALLL